MISDARSCAMKAEAWGAENRTYSGFPVTECVSSSGNSLIVVTATDTTYAVTITNPNARPGRTTCTVTNTGLITWS